MSRSFAFATEVPVYGGWATITARRFHKTVSMKVRDVLKVLAKDGWVLRNNEGSHPQFVHSNKPGQVTVPGHPSIEVPPGTLSSILKQAGLKQ
ncbi:MAG TPA: type II toxin-antitoxin system HicA family toxin [Bryobacteraceae bacterium]|nr:type II toxin-antitoxin system HicA family toxin [Bryobacteraceae bacterium]